MSEQDQPHHDAAMSRRKLLKGAAVAGASAAVFAEPVLRAAPAYGHTGGLSGPHSHHLIAWSSNMDSWIRGDNTGVYMRGMFTETTANTGNGGTGGAGQWDFNSTNAMGTVVASGNPDINTGMVSSTTCTFGNVVVDDPNPMGMSGTGTVVLSNVMDMSFDFTVRDVPDVGDTMIQFGMIHILFDLQC